MDLSSLPGLLKTLNVKRYENDFIDMEKIGRGGYASVYKAKNKIDGHIYAVKKIKLRMRDFRKTFNRELQRVLDEAKFLAELNHQNIVRYYNSWLEATTKPKRPNLGITRIPSDIKGESDNFDESPKLECYDDDDSSGFMFDHSNKDNSKEKKLDSKKFDIVQPALHESRRNMIYARLGQWNSARSLSEDLENSDDDIPMKQQKAKEGSSTPRTGDEILESITLYIQNELCHETLEDYLNKRNQYLQSIKGTKEYGQEKKKYMKEAIAFAKQILNGLSHIHSHFIVHRDLKPSNIFLVNKTLKIGDFGLVKRLNSFSPIESSPFLNDTTPEIDNSAHDGFQLDSHSPESADGLLQQSDIVFHKNYSEPFEANQKHPELFFEIESQMTKSVGTKTFASPEQLKADKQKFDYKADIFSLGIIYLLLFHPMSTVMEQTQTIKESKKGKLPLQLQEEFPELADIIKKMLSDNPTDRPALQVIANHLHLPMEMYIDLTGSLSVRRENSMTWRNKFFKLIENNLYLFDQESDHKAEIVYSLSQWRILFKGNSTNEISLVSTDDNHNSEEDENKRSSFITLENPMQLGCIFRAENYNKTLELYKKFIRLETSV